MIEPLSVSEPPPTELFMKGKILESSDTALIEEISPCIEHKHSSRGVSNLLDTGYRPGLKSRMETVRSRDWRETGRTRQSAHDTGAETGRSQPVSHGGVKTGCDTDTFRAPASCSATAGLGALPHSMAQASRYQTQLDTTCFVSAAVSVWRNTPLCRFCTEHMCGTDVEPEPELRGAIRRGHPLTGTGDHVKLPYRSRQR